MQTPVERYFVWAPDWLVALALVVTAVAVAVIVHALLYNLIVRSGVVASPGREHALRRTRGVTRYGLILFVLSS